MYINKENGSMSRLTNTYVETDDAGLREAIDQVMVNEYPFDEETYMTLIKNGFNILTVKVDDGFVFTVYKNFGEESRTVHLGDEILELVQEFDFNGIVECITKFEDSLNEEDIAIIDEMIYMI
jgi:hypothetical protein